MTNPDTNLDKKKPLTVEDLIRIANSPEANTPEIIAARIKRFEEREKEFQEIANHTRLDLNREYNI